MIKKILHRIIRVLCGKKNIYGKLGKHNRFCQGVLVYENATIGNYNYFSPYTIINNCSIGNYCSIGPGCKIGLGEHDMHAISTYPKVSNGNGPMELFKESNKTTIENDVWLGANVVIKQGVHIATGAVVGAGAVVTKDIPPYAIAVGVPAKVISYRFPEDTANQILNSDWFNKDFSQAITTVSELNNNIFNA